MGPWDQQTDSMVHTEGQQAGEEYERKMMNPTRYSWLWCAMLVVGCAGNTSSRSQPHPQRSEAVGAEQAPAPERPRAGPVMVMDDQDPPPQGRGAHEPIPTPAQMPGDIQMSPECPVPGTPGTRPLDLLLRDGRLPDGPAVDMGIRDGRIVFVQSMGDQPCAATSIQSLGGRWVVPAFVDSHVHLAYLPVGEAMLDGGVAAVVDLAAPMDALGAEHGALRVVASGPMITAMGGYPTRTWGASGYGIQCADTDQALAAANTLHQAGAGVLKIPMGMGPELSREAMAATIARARTLGLPVAVHALSNDAVSRAVALGVDVLAHTPLEPLSDETLAALRGRVVISTLGAFGGRAAIQNLSALHGLGATVLYGTDLGNTEIPGIQRREIELLMEAGLDGRAIIDAGTTAPATFWGFTHLGALSPGKAASLMVLSQNPHTHPSTLAEPAAVLMDGRWRKALVD